MHAATQPDFVELRARQGFGVAQFRMVQEAEEQGRLGREALNASHRLNVLGALFFPLTAVTSLFGMNLSHGMDEHSAVLFWLVCLGAVGLGWGLKSWVVRRPVSSSPCDPR